MDKYELSNEIVAIQDILELAKDNYLEGAMNDAAALLQQAQREMRRLTWKVIPTINED